MESLKLSYSLYCRRTLHYVCSTLSLHHQGCQEANASEFPINVFVYTVCTTKVSKKSAVIFKKIEPNFPKLDKVLKGLIDLQIHNDIALGGEFFSCSLTTQTLC